MGRSQRHIPFAKSIASMAMSLALALTMLAGLLAVSSGHAEDGHGSQAAAAFETAGHHEAHNDCAHGSAPLGGEDVPEHRCSALACAALTLPSSAGSMPVALTVDAVDWQTSESDPRSVLSDPHLRPPRSLT